MNGDHKDNSDHLNEPRPHGQCISYKVHQRKLRSQYGFNPNWWDRNKNWARAVVLLLFVIVMWVAVCAMNPDDDDTDSQNESLMDQRWQNHLTAVAQQQGQHEAWQVQPVLRDEQLQISLSLEPGRKKAQDKQAAQKRIIEAEAEKMMLQQVHDLGSRGIADRPDYPK